MYQLRCPINLRFYMEKIPQSKDCTLCLWCATAEDFEQVVHSHPWPFYESYVVVDRAIKLNRAVAVFLFDRLGKGWSLRPRRRCFVVFFGYINTDEGVQRIFLFFFHCITHRIQTIFVHTLCRRFQKFMSVMRESFIP